MSYTITLKKDTSIKASKIEYNAEWMCASKVTTTIVSLRPVNWSIGDYITYRGERYYLKNIPSVKKTSSDKFTYDNVLFEGVEADLANVEMLDVVLAGDTTTQYTMMPNWSVYCNDVIDFAERVLANIKRIGIMNEWKVLVKYGDDNSYYQVGSSATRPSSESVAGEKSVTVSISEGSVWDSLKNIKEKFNLNFYTSGKNIYIGSANITLPKQFKYGKGNGLFELERNTDSSQKVITKLYARGNSTNMPLRHYQYVNIKLYAEFVSGSYYYGSRPSGSIHQGNLGFLLGESPAHILWTHFSTCTKYALLKGIKRSAVRCMDTENYYTDAIIEANSIQGHVKCYLCDDPQGAILFFTDEQVSLYNAVISGSYRIYFVSGGNKNYWNVDKMEADSSFVPNNVSINNLMLPGYGLEGGLEQVIDDIYDNNKYPIAKQKLSDIGINTKDKFEKTFSYSDSSNEPFLIHQNAFTLGVIEHSVTFDGSVDGYEDIYPSLQFVGDSNKIVSADTITDNGIFDKETKIPNFKVVVNLDFDPSKYISYGSTSFTMHMQTGYCGGRDFNVVGVKSLGSNNYQLSVNRLNDSTLGLYYPYKAVESTDAYQIKAGDTFVLTDLDMPDEYIEQTSVNALLPAAAKYLIDNCYTAYKYSLKVDSIQMQRWCDEQSAAGEQTLHDIINAGCFVNFDDSDLNVSGNITIDKLTIKEGEDMLPKYEVTLSEDKSVGTIDRMQNQIDSIAESILGGTKVPANIEEMIRKVGDKRYMRSDADTGTSGNVKMEKNLEVQSSVRMHSSLGIDGNTTVGGDMQSSNFESSLIGTGWKIGKDGYAEIDSLSIRKFLEVPELRYNRVSVHTGVQWQTFGGGTIEEVTQLTSTTGIIKLKLENGEYGSISDNDLCIGIFHRTDPTENSSATYDDKQGNFKFKGFSTVYFKCIGICDKDGNTGNPDSRNQYFKYELRPQSNYWMEMWHPSASMSFAAYANPTNSSRQSSEYSTTEYSIMLVGMTDWTFGGNNIMLILGNMTGFSIPVEGSSTPKQLSGYGIAFGKAYMWGNIEQFNRDRYIVSQQIMYYGSNDTQSSVTAQWNAGTLTKTDFSTDPIVPSSNTQYVYTIWEYTYSDATNGTSSPACSSVYGSAGKGISSLTTYYKRTSDATAPAVPSLSSDGKSIADWKGWSDTSTASDPTNRYLWAVDIIRYTDATMSVGTAHCTGIQGADASQPNLYGYDTTLVVANNILDNVHTSTGIAGYAVNARSEESNSHYAILVKGLNVISGKTYAVSFKMNTPVSGKVHCWLNGGSSDAAYQVSSAELNEDIVIRCVCGTGSEGLRIQVDEVESYAYSGFFEVVNLKVEDASSINGRNTAFTGLANDSIPQGQNLLLGSGTFNDNWTKRSGSVIEEGTFNGSNVFKYIGTISTYYTIVLSQKVYASRLGTNNWYTISWYQKGNGGLRVYIPFQSTTVPALVDCQPLDSSQALPQKVHTLTSGWERHSVTFLVPSDFTDFKNLNFVPTNGTTEIYISMPKLERVEKPTAWQAAEEDRIGETGPQGEQGIQGDKGDKGDKGDTGSSGIQGCMARLCGEYSSSTPYYNDSELTAPRTGESVRVVDIVQWKDAIGNLHTYARTTKDSGMSGVAPTADGNAYWQKASAEKFIATDILMSKEAWIQTLTGKSIYVTDEDGDVAAGMQSVDDNDTPQIFAGASKSNASSAAFRVYKDGDVVAEKFKTGDSGRRVEVQDGLMQVYGTSGFANIQFGVDDTGRAILSYYDDDGTLKYDLGPDGIIYATQFSAAVYRGIQSYFITTTSDDTIPSNLDDWQDTSYIYQFNDGSKKIGDAMFYSSTAFADNVEDWQNTHTAYQSAVFQYGGTRVPSGNTKKVNCYYITDSYTSMGGYIRHRLIWLDRNGKIFLDGYIYTTQINNHRVLCDEDGTPWSGTSFGLYVSTVNSL